MTEQRDYEDDIMTERHTSLYIPGNSSTVHVVSNYINLSDVFCKVIQKAPVPLRNLQLQQ